MSSSLDRSERERKDDRPHQRFCHNVANLAASLGLLSEVVYELFFQTEPLDVGARDVSDKTMVFQNLEFAREIFVPVRVVSQVGISPAVVYPPFFQDDEFTCGWTRAQVFSHFFEQRGHESFDLCEL